MLPASYTLTPRWFHKVGSDASPLRGAPLMCSVVMIGQRLHDPLNELPHSLVHRALRETGQALRNIHIL